MKRTALPRKTPLSRGDTTLKRTTPLAPVKPKRRAKLPPGVAAEVTRRSKGRCIVCGRKPRQPTRHHVLPVSRWPELETLAANLVLICWEPCHANHENAHRRIRWDELPACAVTLAQTLGGRAVLELERHYPR